MDACSLDTKDDQKGTEVINHKVIIVLYLLCIVMRSSDHHPVVHYCGSVQHKKKKNSINTLKKTDRIC